MDSKAIIQLMNSTLDFDLTLDDFNKPVPARVQLICQAFIMYVFEVPESSMSHLPLAALSPDDDSEHLQRAAPLIVLYATMNQFIQDMALDHQFGMCDLISPEPRRFRRLISLLANYLKFHTTMMPHWNKTVDSFQQQRDTLVELQREAEEAKATKAVLDAEAEVRKQKENELLTTLAKKQSELQEHYMRSSELEVIVEKHKRETAEQGDIQEDLIMERDSLHLQVDQLSLQILGSPERILKDVDQLKEEVVISRENCDKQRRINEETKNQLKIAGDISQMIDNLGKHLEDKMLKEKVNLDWQRANMEEVEERKREIEAELTNYLNDIKKAESELQEVEANFNKERAMHAERLQELAEEKEKLEIELDELKINNVTPTSEIALQKKITAIRQEKSEVNRILLSDISRASEDYIARVKNLEEVRMSACKQLDEASKVLHTVRAVFNEKSVGKNANETLNESML